MSIGNPYGGRLLVGMEEACRKSGYDLLLVNISGEDSGRVCQQKLAENRVDGMIILRSFVCEALLDDLSAYADHVVLVDAVEPYPQFHTVCFDNAHAIEMAVEYLAQLGHQRIGYLGSCLEDSLKPWVMREQGYLSALRRLGLPVDERYLHNRKITQLSKTETYCQAEGMFGMRYFLGMGDERPTAVIAYNDLVAVNACNVCRDLGVAVPSQMSVIGLGNSERCEYVYPALTSLEHPLEKMGQVAVEHLVRLVEMKQQPSSEPIQAFTSKLVHRQSVASLAL